MSMDLPLLWHIPLSHFNEKVRWALDFKNIPHRRERVGADYLFKAWRATGHGTLPILFLDGQPIRDSTAIIAELEQRYGEPALYPKDEAQRRHALELEDYFDEMLGPSVRAAIISPLLRRRQERLRRALVTSVVGHV
jgi:glutathione S-transferase